MILTKLHLPSHHHDLVFRPDLFDKLNLAKRSRLLLVSAQAGFGKTSLISEWIHRNSIAATWYSLDAGDNDPNDFFSYLIEDAGRLDPEWCRDARAVLVTAGASAPEHLVTELVDRLHAEFGATVETRTLVEEDVSFSLPRTLKSLSVLS